MTPLQLVYDFETPVEMALAIAIGASNICVYTATNDGFVTPAWQSANPALTDYVLSTQVFQMKRPRVDLVAQVGAAAGHNFPETGFDPIGGYCHDGGRMLALNLTLVTDTQILKHRQYIAEVRGVMATILRRINGDLILPDAITGAQLMNHRIAELSETGSTAAYKNNEGYYTTVLQYAGPLTMQQDAIEALTTA
jgi:hypothetical protein